MFCFLLPRTARGNYSSVYLDGRVLPGFLLLLLRAWVVVRATLLSHLHRPPLRQRSALLLHFRRTSLDEEGGDELGQQNRIE